MFLEAEANDKWWIFTKAKEASGDEVAYCQVVAILLSKLKKWQIHFNYITSVVLPLLMLLNSSATLRLHFVPSRPSSISEFNLFNSFPASQVFFFFFYFYFIF